MYYTKYRPQKFSEISQPNDTAIALQNQLKSKKTAHAYLFVGSRGTGKTTTARILAKALNCEHLSKEADPCDECDSCIGIKNGSFMDLIEIDAASNRGIDDIRQLREKIKLAPSKGKNKVYIIDEVHMLTSEAFNALLKTLEEPPAKVSFILCTTELHKVPDTIKSRCQIFKFKRATLTQLINKLKKICEKEGAKISDPVLKQIASASYGGFRDAETLLQQIVEGELSIELLTSINSQKSYAEFVDLLVKKEVNECFFYINKIYEDGIDLYVWTGEFLKYLRNIMFFKSGCSIDDLEISDEVLETLEKQADIIETADLIRILDIMIEAQNNIKSNYIVQLPIEIAIVKIINFSDFLHYNNKQVIKNNDDPNAVKITKIKADEEDVKEPLKEEKKAKENKKEAAVNMNSVLANWGSVINKVQNFNHGIAALLKASRIVDIDGKLIKLEVPFDFYKERLESTKNRGVIEKAILEVFDREMSISCKVIKQERVKTDDKVSGKLTDFNLVPSQIKSDKSSSELLTMLDGSLPFN